MASEPTTILDSLIDIIRRTAEPERIILFGSRAANAARTQSDYDFLVIVPNVENERQISRRTYRALLEQHIDVPVDIIVVDEATLERHRNTPGMIYRTAVAEGEVIYDRTRS